MAQKLALLHNGTRKTVSVGPRMIVQDLIGSVAALYGIDTTASAVSLQHRHVLLNPAEIVCHISIPNNATIDVIVTSRKSAVGGVTKLTLVGRDKSTWTSSFPSHSSLQDVISAALSATNTDGTAVFSAADVPVGVIYMRRPCTGEALTAKLSDLGLAGQAAKLQLIFGDNAPPVSDQDIASTVAVLPSQVAIADACGVADLGRPDMQGDISGPPAGSVAAPPLSAVHVDLDVAPIAPSIPASYDTTPAVVSHNCDDAINHILTNNFDVASQPAILLFLKYIDNILKNPTDIKYHRIPTSNKVYVEKLGRLRGTDELLSAAGFFKKAEDATVWLARVECDISHWKVVRKSIIMAVETLSISSDLYSTSPPAPNIFSAVPAPVEFDPFRAMVTKTFSTDGANTKILSTDNKGIYMTETDKKLAGIERRRVELEGRPEDVERLTQVIFPGQAGVESLLLRMGNGELMGADLMDIDDSSASRVDSKLLAQHMAAKQVAIGEANAPPLITNAIRQLERAKKQIIYSTSVVRIRFQDKVIIQGMFHPRDTIRSVYDWAKSCLAENITNAFEIYMSPPKVVYDSVSEMTLLEAGMVPAVSLFLSWTEPIVAAAIGCYLRSDMQPNPTSDMEVAEEKGILQTPSVSFVRSNISFPQGTSLVPKPVGAVSSSARYSEDEADNKKPELGNTEKKPKWFKL